MHLRFNIINLINMKIANLVIVATLLIFCSCGQRDQNAELADTSATNSSITQTAEQPAKTAQECTPGERVIYQNTTFSSYTEDKMRGKGVVSITLKVNDRLDIYNEDDSVFGYLVLNEDMTFYLADMPKRIVARKVVPEHDMAAFDFDADDSGDAEYLQVYINKERKKIKKAGLEHRYRPWSEYIKAQTIALKPCNKLASAPSIDPNALFDITALNDDEISISLSKDCGGEDAPTVKASGKVKWRKGDMLLVDLMTCN